jgi:4-hydroxyphenylpyruvate dioxygenase
MIPCISQVTTLPASFDADVRSYAKAGSSAMEVWLTKLETFVEHHSVDAVRRLAADAGVRLAAAAGQGGILFAQGDARRESFALLERRLELCQTLGIATLVVAVDVGGDIDATAYERAIVSLKQAAGLARAHGVRLALEFQGRARLCNNLHTAVSLLEHCGEANAGLCLDVFEYYIGPSKLEDLALVTRANLFHVQLSDLAGIPRELATDSDRVLPGDGDFQLQPIIGHLRTIGYDGFVSVELMNPELWRMPPDRVAEVAITALRKVLGLAEA